MANRYDRSRRRVRRLSNGDDIELSEMELDISDEAILNFANRRIERCMQDISDAYEEGDYHSVGILAERLAYAAGMGNELTGR